MLIVLHPVQVLVAASKGLAFSGGSPMAQLANQAAVQENGAADSGEPDAPIRVSEHGSVKGAWERFKGYLAGLVAALITTLYTVSFLLRFSLCADLLPATLMELSM